MPGIGPGGKPARPEPAWKVGRKPRVVDVAAGSCCIAFATTYIVIRYL
jgi:hypothetical protein